MTGNDKVDNGGHRALVAVAAHEGQIVHSSLGAELAHTVWRRLARTMQSLLPLYRILRSAASQLSWLAFPSLALLLNSCAHMRSTATPHDGVLARMAHHEHACTPGVYAMLASRTPQM